MNLKLSPMSRDQLMSLLHVVLWAAASAAVAALIAWMASNAALFGPLTPVINAALYAAKLFFTEPSK